MNIKKSMIFILFFIIISGITTINATDNSNTTTEIESNTIEYPIVHNNTIQKENTIQEDNIITENKKEDIKNKIKPQISFKPVNTTIGNKINIKADFNKNATGNVAFKINKKTITKQTIKITNGTASYSYTIPSTWSAKNYNLSLSYSGNKEYNSTKTDTTLTLTKLPTIMTMKNITSKPGSTITLETQVINTLNQPIVNKTIGFKINGKTIGNAITNNNGKAILNYTIPSTYSVKEYNLTSVFGSDSRNSANITNAILKLNKLGTIILVQQITSDVKVNTTFIATIRDENNNPVLGSLSFKINSLNIGSQPIVNKTSTIKYTIPTSWLEKTVTITVTYLGTSKYKSSTANNTLIITNKVSSYVDPLKGSNNNNGEENTPYQTIKYALTKTNGTIYLKEGIYKESNITLDKSVNIYGTNQENTIIEKSMENSYLFNIILKTVTIKNLTIRNFTSILEEISPIKNTGSLTLNRVTMENNKAEEGGAIYNIGAINIVNSNFKNNIVTNEGGAIYNEGTLKISDSNFINNKAVFNFEFEGDGGAIYNDEGIIIITNSIFKNNYALNRGGAISNDDGNITITYSKFLNNQADIDGACIENDGFMEVRTSTFSNNKAQSRAGSIENNEIMNIAKCVFINNTASYRGGAITNWDTLTISESNFINNNATNEGGAIENRYNLTVVNSNFSYNKATNEGGAIYNINILNITNSNIINNVASIGNAISTNKLPYIEDNWWNSNSPNWNVLLNNVIYKPNRWITK
ncbi:MAG: hypothetical protein Q4Q23_02460 [Methanobacteriaceae archaeon]|nr:hypothetical protein [Methanobacteriaceae archaeon]